MGRHQTQLEALTPGQLARRWGVSVARVRVLIHAGQIPGAFRIPSAGRYGESLKIPLANVLQVEQAWAIVPTAVTAERRRPTRRDGTTPRLKHFPELNVLPEHDAGCLGDAPL